MSGKKVTAAMVRREYQQHIAAFGKCIPDSALRLRFLLAADNYFRKCAVCVWSQGGPVTENHVEAYNAICSKGSAPGEALYFEVFSAVMAHPQFEPPVFFSAMEDCDRVHGSHVTAQFVELCSLMMTLFAAVDDQVTQEETDYVDQCVRVLKGGSGAQPQQAGPIVPPVSGSQAGAAEAAAAQETSEEEEKGPTVEELLAELDELCGLEQVKKDVRSLINLVKVRKLREENDLPVPPMSLHLVFMGNPGTGKTTVARLLARLYHAIGVLSKGQLVEVDRSGLVAGYVGQTATKTQAVIDSALGGVLFIDEAYSLTNQDSPNDFGREAIEVLLKNMEDHRKDLIVIVAGYSNLMGQFINSNPGLESRFNKYFYFEDYNGEQLSQIFFSLCKKNGYTPDKEMEEYAPAFFQQLFEERDENFGNARDVRNLFEKLISAQSDRVSALENPTREDLMAVTLADFKTAAEETEEETSRES